MADSMNNSPPSSQRIAENLYRKNKELENGLQKSAQLKLPSDPNAWLQMRENYEAIMLEDHDFAEKHEVEFTLWKLHYKRIEEFRTHINGSITSQAGKDLGRPDRVSKIRSVFKSFLSESTGFYHDLILKIRVKYGLPLGYISEVPQNHFFLAKDLKKSAEMKKGLLSCHRCLIYLGDLARYKGLYGGDNGSRDYGVAYSYYVQAASLFPSGGNPHHQLAILASYSGDVLLAVYRYFRSLAAESPFSTARNNLIGAFEKNRQIHSQIPDVVKDHQLSIPEVFRVFSTGFVRLNGILFTRTSLEAFQDVYSAVIGNLLELLSSGPEEKLNFGRDASENGLFTVRLISVLIFSSQSVDGESEGHSYTEITHHKMRLQNAFSATFEFVGLILKRCAELIDITSSHLLPAILVFFEWLACHPDIVSRTDIEVTEATIRSFFLNQCISFMNKLILTGLVCFDGDDDTACFSNMSLYDEEETGNRIALWEDFELRGFSPLVPAQRILDFSRNHCLNDEGIKEKKARVTRILAAGKALMQYHQGVHYDSNLKKFTISNNAPVLLYTNQKDFLVSSESNGIKQTNLPAKIRTTQPNKVSRYAEEEEEEEEEEIVFQPTVSENLPNLSVSDEIYSGRIQDLRNCSYGDLESHCGMPCSLSSNLKLTPVLNSASQQCTAVPSISQPPPCENGMNTSNRLVDQESFFNNGLQMLGIAESGLNGLRPSASSPFFPATANFKPVVLTSQNNVEADMPSKHDSNDFPVKLSAPLPVASRKNPVTRPLRHFGPPPGFSNAPAKRPECINYQNPQMDDYSWLDGYQTSSTKSIRLGDPINHATHMQNVNIYQGSQFSDQLEPYPNQNFTSK